jgi:hypothetical protein
MIMSSISDTRDLILYTISIASFYMSEVQGREVQCDYTLARASVKVLFSRPLTLLEKAWPFQLISTSTMTSAYYPTYIGLSRSIAVYIYPALAQLVATSKMLLPWTVFADVINSDK